MKIFIFALLFIAAFGGIETSAQSNSLHGGKWILISIGDREVPNSRAYIEFAEDGKISGNASCNRYFGGVSTTRNAIKFSGIGSTRMMCPDAMEDEAAFLEALRNATRFRVRDGKLTLFAGRAAVLVFGHEGGDMSSGAGLENTRWMLEAIKGENVGTLEQEAFIRFNSAEKSVGGNTSCNVFGGNATWGEGKFSFSQGISTLRACIEDSRMNVERGLLDGLNNADRYVVRSGKLELYSGNDLLLTFIGKNN